MERKASKAEQSAGGVLNVLAAVGVTNPKATKDNKELITKQKVRKGRSMARVLAMES